MISNGAALASIGLERGNCLLGQVVQLVAIQILAHALIDARIGALQIEQGANDVDVQVLVGELGRRHDLVGDAQHELGERGLAELGVPELVERGRIDYGRIADQTLGKPGERAWPALIGVVGLLQRAISRRK